jgi:hypothetical protein
MEPGIFLTLREFKKLEGLSDLAFRTYIGIRLKMDIATRISGEYASNSLNGLAMFAEQQITRGKGVQLVRPTRRQIGIAIDSLQRKQLLDAYGEPGTMIYRLPLAWSRAESQAQKAASALARSAHTRNSDVTAQQPAIPAATRESGSTRDNKTAEPVTYKASGVFASKSIATAPSDSPAISPNAANAFNWMKTACDGHRIAKPTGANVDALEALFRAGPGAVAIATQTALQRRRAENSSAPIQPRLVEKCLPKGSTAPAPTRISPSTSRTPPPRPVTIQRSMDSETIAEGMRVFGNIARGRLAKQELS